MAAGAGHYLTAARCRTCGSTRPDCAPQPDDPALCPNVPAGSGHRGDVLTYYRNAGAIPGTDPTASWQGWATPATRGWFALAEWRALDSYWGVDRVE